MNSRAEEDCRELVASLQIEAGWDLETPFLPRERRIDS